MDQLDRRRGAIHRGLHGDRTAIDGARLARGIDERGAHPLATAQHGIAHGRVQTFGLRIRRGQTFAQHGFDVLYTALQPIRERKMLLSHSVLFFIERMRIQRTQQAVLEDFDLLLGLGQTLLANTGELDAPAISSQRLLERQRSPFHGGDQCLELGQGRLEILRQRTVVLRRIGVRGSDQTGLRTRKKSLTLELYEIANDTRFAVMTPGRRKRLSLDGDNAEKPSRASRAANR